MLPELVQGWTCCCLSPFPASAKHPLNLQYVNVNASRSLPGTTQTPDTPHTPKPCRSRYPTPRTPGCSSRATKSELDPSRPLRILPANPHNSYDAEDGAVIRNIDACRTIAQTVQTSLGPYGRNKIVINHLQKMILTSDAATILRELEVVHPAAKLLVMASQQQEAEMGDATNLVIVLAGELLKKAEELIRMGLKTSDIVLGYEKAQNAAQQVLEGMSCKSVWTTPGLGVQYGA
jgi:hypothetical protein